MCTLVKFAKIIRRPWAHPASYHKWEFGKISFTATSCAYFLPFIFFAVRSMLFPISAHYFCQLRPKPWREKNECWIIFFQRHGEKKGLMFLLSWKMTIFPIFLCLLCVGEWWPTHRELPESLCLSAFILFICENKKIDSNEIILGSHIRKSSLGYILKSLHFMRKLWPIANNIVGNSISLKQFILKV